MPTPSIGEAVRELAERTARGIKKGHIVAMGEGTAMVQTGQDMVLCKPTTDEVLRAGDPVWIQPVQKGTGMQVIHGKG